MIGRGQDALIGSRRGSRPNIFANESYGYINGR